MQAAVTLAVTCHNVPLPSMRQKRSGEGGGGRGPRSERSNGLGEVVGGSREEVEGGKVMDGSSGGIVIGVLHSL